MTLFVINGIPIGIGGRRNYYSGMKNDFEMWTAGRSLLLLETSRIKVQFDANTYKSAV